MPSENPKKKVLNDPNIGNSGSAPPAISFFGENNEKPNIEQETKQKNWNIHKENNKEALLSIELLKEFDEFWQPLYENLKSAKDKCESDSKIFTDKVEFEILSLEKLALDQTQERAELFSSRIKKFQCLGFSIFTLIDASIGIMIKSAGGFDHFSDPDSLAFSGITLVTATSFALSVIKAVNVAHAKLANSLPDNIKSNWKTLYSKYEILQSFDAMSKININACIDNMEVTELVNRLNLLIPAVTVGCSAINKVFLANVESFEVEYFSRALKNNKLEVASVPENLSIKILEKQQENSDDTLLTEEQKSNHTNFVNSCINEFEDALNILTKKPNDEVVIDIRHDGSRNNNDESDSIRLLPR